MSILVLITVAAGAGSTHTWDVIQSATGNLATPDVLATVTNIAATLTAGYAFEIPIPQGSVSKLFLGYQNTATGGTTTVTADAYLLPSDEIPKFRSFPKVVDAAV